jgi:hypothetical protein
LRSRRWPSFRSRRHTPCMRRVRRARAKSSPPTSAVADSLADEFHTRRFGAGVRSSHPSVPRIATRPRTRLMIPTPGSEAERREGRARLSANSASAKRQGRSTRRARREPS